MGRESWGKQRVKGIEREKEGQMRKLAMTGNSGEVKRGKPGRPGMG